MKIVSVFIIDDQVELLNSEDKPYTSGRVVGLSEDKSLVFTKSEHNVARANGWPVKRVRIIESSTREAKR